MRNSYSGEFKYHQLQGRESSLQVSTHTRSNKLLSRVIDTPRWSVLVPLEGPNYHPLRTYPWPCPSLDSNGQYFLLALSERTLNCFYVHSTVLFSTINGILLPPPLESSSLIWIFQLVKLSSSASITTRGHSNRHFSHSFIRSHPFERPIVWLLTLIQMGWRDAVKMFN